jgi:hypothetical protein
MGLSLHNALAVFRGWLGQRSDFIRTPKFAVVGTRDRWQDKTYVSRRIGWLTGLELLLALYFLAGAGIGLYYRDYGLLPFHLMSAFGFGLIVFYSVRHALVPRATGS